jgi:hypothetical protein
MRYGQAVLQCRQDPASFRPQEETMRFGPLAELCRCWPDAGAVERVSERTGAIIPYGIMIRTFPEGTDPDFFRSPVDRKRGVVPWRAPRKDGEDDLVDSEAEGNGNDY